MLAAEIEAGECPNIDRIIEEMRLPPNLEIKTTETSSAQWLRRNLLFFKQLCDRTDQFLPGDSIVRSMYILEFSEKITREYFPADELLDLDIWDSRVEAYIREGKNAGDPVLPELKEIVDYAERNLVISPFDILTYKTWNETPESLQQFMTTSKKEAGSGRGRKKTKAKPFDEIIPKLERYQGWRNTYFQLVFEDQAGYGSGMPTYEWAFRLASLIDEIANEPQLQDVFRNDLDSQKELVELSIHSFFLSEFVEEAKGQIMRIGKYILV